MADVLADRGVAFKGFERLGIPQVYAGFGEDEQLRDKHGYGLDATIAATRRVITEVLTNRRASSTERRMRTVAVTKIGSLRDPDEESRGRIGVVDFPEPSLGPEDVRIRVAYSAICGSDPHLAEGFFGTDVPIGLGHELSGVVEAVGGGVRTGVRVGDRVAGNFLRFCGSCRACRDGRQQFCDNIQDYNRPGMSETITWHESQVYPLPDSVSLLEGCLLEPVSVAVRIADKARARPGDRVLVCGGGPIGQLALQVMRMSGATSLTLVEPIAERRAMALRSGADHVIDPVGEDQAARVAEITGGLGFDIVIDASGSPRAVRGLLDVAARAEPSSTGRCTRTTSKCHSTSPTTSTSRN